MQLGEKIVKVGHNEIKFISDVSGHAFKPIPLTPEWLERFGFQKTKNGGTFAEYYWSGKGMDLTLDLELSTSTPEYDSQYVSGSTQLKHVHQLQNLYFALTGEELEIKL